MPSAPRRFSGPSRTQSGHESGATPRHTAACPPLVPRSAGSRYYGYGHSGLLHGGHGTRAARRRQPLRGRARRAARDSGAAVVAPEAGRSSVLGAGRLPAGPASGRGFYRPRRHFVGSPRVGAARRVRRAARGGAQPGLDGDSQPSAGGRDLESLLATRRPVHHAPPVPGALGPDLLGG